MTEAMPFLQKTILLSYDPRPLGVAVFSFLRQKSGIFVFGKKVIKCGEGLYLCFFASR